MSCYSKPPSTRRSAGLPERRSHRMRQHGRSRPGESREAAEESRQEKIQRFELEIQRIQDKELTTSTSLSSNQRAQIEKLRHAIAKLRRESTERAAPRDDESDPELDDDPDDETDEEEELAVEEDVDDFFDRAHAKRVRLDPERALGYDELRAAAAVSRARVDELEKSLQGFESNAPKADEEDEEEDPLDAFMKVNNGKLKSDEELRVREDLAEAKKETARLTRLEELAKPIQLSTSVPISSSSAKALLANTAAASEKPPPKAQPPAKPSLSVSEFFTQNLSSSAARPSTATSLVSERSVSKESEDVYRDEEIDDASTSTWKPPSHQRGDGRTEKNDEYGY